MPRVRLLAVALITLQLGAPPSPISVEGGDTVRLVVPTGRGLTESRDVVPGSGWVRVETPLETSLADTLEMARETMGPFVFPEILYGLLGPEDEPLFEDEWHLENTGQAGGVVDADVDAAAAWPKSTGGGVVVAIVDSGIDSTHPDLDGQLWVNPGEVAGDGIDNDANGLIDDINGWDFVAWDNDPTPDGFGSAEAHGTRVAGVVAAAENGYGVTGIAPDVKLMSLRACTGDDGCWSLDAADAIYYAVFMGADVINLSFGSEVPETWGDPVMEDAIDFARVNDVLVVTAAGNTPPEEIPDGWVLLPAEFQMSNNLSVAATDRDDNMTSFSFWGSTIGIAAPGDEILTTDVPGFAYVTGTSFSAPVASGAAALAMARWPELDHHEIIGRLRGFADQPSDIVEKTQSGRLNAAKPVLHRFVDSAGHLFEFDIEWLAGENITYGCNPPSNIFFCPGAPVTREVMAAFLTRALDLPPASKDYFTDDEGSIFEDDINRLAEAGITKGCNPPVNTTFCPKTVVDRGQMAAFLTRALGLTDDGGGDLFVDDDGSLFEHDIDRLGAAGITKGCNPPANTKYCPSGPVSRGAMAAFLHRALGS